VVEPVSFDEFGRWSQGFIQLPTHDELLYRANRPGNLWLETLPSGDIYARLVQVQSVEQAALDQLNELGSRPDVGKVIFDLRHNGGGNNFTYPPLLEVLQQIAGDEPGRLYVLTDRLTFSAASNLATELEQSTPAIFAGEPMGGGLNFWNDVSFYPLPHLPIPMRVGISTIYWEKSTPDDPRLTIDPDLAVANLASHYFAGRDAVLEAVFAS
jgi:C-terminal processing protease CtpA/Prc